jgi:NAD(P)-dependent dehydrogenase (short-subunit alcohol dehydrogenase family)
MTSKADVWVNDCAWQIQVALPHLRQTKGQILMTSSGVSLTPYAAWTAYACSKAAMNWLGACLTKEEGEVTTLCIEPGIVDSGLQKQVRDDRKFISLSVVSH